MSFTFDAWTSDSGHPYLSVTGHYIANRKGKPEEWELKSNQLAFTHLEGRHSGANISKVLVRTIDCYGIWQKVASFPFHCSITGLDLRSGWMVHGQQCGQQ